MAILGLDKIQGGGLAQSLTPNLLAAEQIKDRKRQRALDFVTQAGGGFAQAGQRAENIAGTRELFDEVAQGVQQPQIAPEQADLILEQGQLTDPLKANALQQSGVIEAAQDGTDEQLHSTLVQHKAEIDARGGDSSDTTEAIAAVEQGQAPLVRQAFTNIGQLLQQSPRARQLIAEDPRRLALLERTGLGDGASSANNVQSKFITENGTIGLVMRNGDTKDTGVRVSDTTQLTDEGLVFNKRTGSLSEAGRGDALTPEQIKDAQKKSRAAKATAKAAETFKINNAKEAVEAGKVAVSQIAAIDQNLLTLDEAIAAIDSGAKTGRIQQMAPSFRASTQKLENAAARLGLGVVAVSKFGALSAGELKLAMMTAMPTNLDEKELRKWLVDRKAAQNKFRDGLAELASFASQGISPTDSFLTREAEKEKTKKEGVKDLSFDSQGNFIQ